ncbi:radical SAM protein [Kitasatospora sp. NPDC004240]
MELAELIGLRPVPAAGLLVTLTRRCPLSCAHCSTSSDLTGEQLPAGRLQALADSFTPDDRPEVMLLTGGEPLLRPDLCARLARTARRVGTRTALLSGMFFARDGRVPDRVLDAVTAVDHFSASLDAFHEREVPRAAVFRTLHRIRRAGVAVSFHLAGTGPADPYLAEVTADIRREFADRVPMLVNEVRPLGRAASWATPALPPPDASLVLPCTMAAWPTVAFDGTVLACCNQRTVDLRPAPAHLRLGHIAEDGWPELRRRALTSPALRMLRAIGPAQLYHRFGDVAAPEGYCAGCRALGDHPELLHAVERTGGGPAGALLELTATRQQTEAGPIALMRRHGCARYADLVALPASAPAGRPL